MKLHLLWTQPCVRILKSRHRFGKFPLAHRQWRANTGPIVVLSKYEDHQPTEGSWLRKLCEKLLENYVKNYVKNYWRIMRKLCENYVRNYVKITWNYVKIMWNYVKNYWRIMRKLCENYEKIMWEIMWKLWEIMWKLCENYEKIMWKILVLELQQRLQRHITVTLYSMFRQQSQTNLSDCHGTVPQCTCQTWIQIHARSNTSLKKSWYQFAIVYACALNLWHEGGEHSDLFTKTCIMWRASNYVGRQWLWVQWINHFTQLVTSSTTHYEPRPPCTASLPTVTMSNILLSGSLITRVSTAVSSH